MVSSKLQWLRGSAYKYQDYALCKAECVYVYGHNITVWHGRTYDAGEPINAENRYVSRTGSPEDG